MAERRMFAKTIIDSDEFLDMPLSTQALYFHLSMRADDEGFINNPKKIMRMIGASQNELEILIAKRYILSFDTGVIVIKHWKIHNYIQKDRFKPTLYKEEKDLIGTKENKSYTESFKVMDTKCIQDGDTGKSKVRLGKVSLGKCSIEGASPSLLKKFEEFIDYRKEIKKPLKTTNVIDGLYKALGSEFKTEEDLIFCIDYTMKNEYQGVKGDYLRYKPKNTTSVEIDFNNLGDVF